MIYWVPRWSQIDSSKHLGTDEDTAPLRLNAPVLIPKGLEFNIARRSRIYFRFFVGVFIVLFAYTLIRTIWSYNYPQPDMPLNEDGIVSTQLPREMERHGLRAGDKVRLQNEEVALPGKSSRLESIGRDFPKLYSIVRKTSGNTETTIPLYWYEVKRWPLFEVTASATLTPLSADLIDTWPAQNLQLKTVNGKEIIDGVQAKTGLANVRSASLALTFFSESENAEIIVVTTPLSWTNYWALLAIGTLLGLLGLFVVWMKPLATSSWAFAAFCIGFAVFSFARAIPYEYRLWFESYFYFAALCALPTFIAIMLFSFTSLRLFLHEPASKLVGVCALTTSLFVAMIAANTTRSVDTVDGIGGPTTVFLALIFVPVLFWLSTFSPRWRPSRPQHYLAFVAAFSVELAASGILLYPEEARRGLLGEPLFIGWVVYLTGSIPAILPIDYILAFRGIKLSSEERIRSKVMRFASLLGFFPIGLYVLMRTFMGENVAELRILAECSVLFFPAVIGFSLINLNMLQINRLILRTSIALGMSTFLVVVFYALVIFIWPILDARLPPSAIWLKAACVAALVIFGIFLHRISMKLLAIRFSSDLPDETSFFDQIHDESARLKNAYDLDALISKRTCHILKIKHLGLVLYQPILSNADAMATNSEDTDLLDHEEGNYLLDLLERNRSPLFRVSLSEQLDSLPINARAHQALLKIRAEVAIPLFDESEVVGALVAGEKTDSGLFSPEEFEFLERLAKRLESTVTRVIRDSVVASGIRIIDMFPAAPEKIGSYTVERSLAQGGMSFVYVATEGRNRYAIKVANHKVQSDPIMLERFHREAKVLSRLHHKNIVPIVDFGWVNKEPYIVVEYYPHGSLKVLLRKRGVLSEEEVLDCIRQASSGLSKALSEGIVHRDVKPHNLYMTENGTLKVADFGISRIADEETITDSQEILGTMPYISPEQFAGERGDWLSDQYALGVTAFELLCGSRPYEGSTMEAQMLHKVSGSVPSIQTLRPEISLKTSLIVARMLAKNPKDRFSSYDELVKNLST